MNTISSRHLTYVGSWTRFMLVWLVLVSTLLLIGPREADAEGSVNLSANGGKRAITEWRTSMYGNLLPRRTLLKVYANAGEVINLGSSAAGVDSGDIVVWTPGQITAPLTVALPTPAFSCKTGGIDQTAQPTNGKLDSRAKELAGPLPNSGGYTPCTYNVPSTGTYNVAFYGPLGGSSNSDGNPGTIAAPIVNNTQGSGVSMWDITVRNSAGTTSYSGRVFTDYLAQLSGGNGPTFRIYSTVYALTADGFKYQIDLRGLDPWGFILYGNTVGYLNPDNTTPLYHDLVDITTPGGGARLSPPTGLLFFNLPDAGLPATIAPTPVTPSLNSITFAGSAGGIYSSLGTGGNFVYSGNVGGVAEVVIAANPGTNLAACSTANFDAALTTNRVIRAALPGGVQNLAWDGKDNNGVNVPVSYPGNSGKGYCFKATLHAGEYHFPLLDAENSMLGGPTITLLNAPGGACPFSSISPCRTAFFDDRVYKTTNGSTVPYGGTIGNVLPGAGPPPAPYSSLTGFDTASTTIRKYGNDAGGFGDNKGLDLWTYFPSPDVIGQLYVKPAGSQDLAISKTHSGDFTIGVSNTYTLNVRNVGTGALSGLITVTDPVPVGLTLVSAVGTGWNCAGTSGQNVECTLTASNLAAGASLNNITVTVTPQAAAATGADIVNTASLANTADTNSANNSSSSPTTLISADLAVTKTASSASPVEGAPVSYTITITNNGPSTADSVSVADAIPTGLTFVSATPTQGSYATGTWSVGTLLKNATATLTLTATVNSGQSGQTIGNTATVSGGPFDYASANNTASASLTVPATVLTGIVTDQKTDSPLAGVSVQVTDSAAHTYMVTTDGDGRYTITGSPANPLAAGIATVSVSSPGYVTATPSPTVVAGSSATQNQALTPLSLSGTLTDLGDGVPIVGATVTLTQGALTCTMTTTAGGAYSFTHSAGCLLVAGAATVSSTPTGYATASASPTILATGPTTQNLQAGTVDLVITKTDGVVTVQAGDTLNYVLTVVNNGSIAAEAVTLKDTFPSACLDFISDNSGITKTGTGTSADPYTWVMNGSLASKATWTFPVTALVKTDAPTNCPSGIVNYAKVFTTSPENNGPNNEVSDIDTVAQAPDLVITKTDSETQVQAGQTLTYTIAYQNTGNKAATGVTIVDTLQSGVEIIAGQLSGATYTGSTPSSTYSAPSGNQPGTLTWWTIGDLAVNGTGSITLSLKVKSDVAPGSVVTNRVAITHNAGDGTDPNPGNNTATDSDLVTAPAIVLEKRVTGPTYVGQAVTYSIDWRNVGATTAKSVTITDTLPANTTLVGGSITGGGTLNGSVITWNLGDQGAGASGSVGFQVIPNTSAGGATQTAPTLTTETGSGSVTVTSSTTPLALPYCQTALAGTIAVTNGSAAVTGTGTAFATELAAGNRIAITGVLYQVLSVTDATHLTLTAAYAGATGSGITATNATCLALMNRYQGTDGTPPTGWNDNPRLTVFDDSAWTQAGEAEPEYPHWTQPDNLSAEWVAPNKDPHLVGNFTFFRQGFCLPLNATGLSARLELAGDDVSTIYLNGSGLGQQIGAGGANAFTDSTAIQAGMNVLAVQLLNNRHGGHPFPTCPGCDHIGLLFNLNAAYTGLRPFVAAPAAAMAVQSLSFAADPLVLGGRAPFQYRFDFGDSTVIDYQETATQTHAYGTAGTYSATVTARDAYGCTGSDQILVTVLPATGNLLANAASAAYQDASAHAFTASSGTGMDLEEAADLVMAKTVTSGVPIPGQGITYQLLVTNNGPNAVTGASVTDTVPAAVTGVTWTCVSAGGTCVHASGSGNGLAETVNLPSGATATYTVTGTVNPAATGTLANTAMVAPPDGVTDLVSDNDTATTSASLTTTLDLSITKTSSPTHALPGGEITYTISVHNAGPSDAIGARVTDTTPDEVGLVTWTCSASSGSSCAASGTVKIDDTVNIKSGGALTYTMIGTLDPSGVAPVQNTATVTAPAGATDTNSGNNAATDTNTPTQVALTGVVRVNEEVQAGASVTVVDNAGHSYTTTTNASGVYSFASTEANPLAIGVATITATYSDYVPKVESKTLTAGANTQDLSLLSSELDLAVTLESHPVPFVAGESLTYTIVVSHLSGPAVATDTRVQVTLPTLPGVTWTWTCTADGAGGVCADASGSGNIDRLVTLPVGTHVTYSVTGNIPSGTTGSLATTVSVTAPEGTTDPDTANNTATDTNPPIPTYTLVDAFTVGVRGAQVLVEWDTQSELGTQGFELARLDAAGEFQPLHEGLISGQSPAGEGGSYRFLDPSAVPGVAATYRLTEVERTGNRRVVGQFPVTPLAPPAIAQAKQAAQPAVPLAPGHFEFTPRALTPAETERLQARRAERDGADHWGQRSQGLGAVNSAGPPANRAAVGVRETGLYQVSTSALALTLDWPEGKVKGLLQAGQLRLTNQGADIAWQAAAKDQGLLFYGEASRSIYDPENVYVVRQGAGTRMAKTQVRAQGPLSADSFRATVAVEENRFGATGLAKDPEEDYWFWSSLMNGGAACGTGTQYLGCGSRIFTLAAPEATGSGAAQVRVWLRGASATAANPDHRVRVVLNGTLLGEGQWDGLTDYRLDLSLEGSLLHADGQNQLQILALADPGVPVAANIFYLDRLELDYPRRYLAAQDSLRVTGEPGTLLTVVGFTSPAIQVFDLSDPRLPRAVTGAKIQGGSGGYQVSLVPANATTPYLLVAEGAVRAPARIRPMETTGLAGAKAGAPYLVIAPGDFYDEATQPVQRLLSLRSSQGLNGRFVPLEGLYDEYGDGQKTPHAIRRFLAEAVTTWPVPPAYVLLAGKGTFDPKDYLGYGTDRLPVLMALTPGAGLIAADQRFVDVNADGIGDLAIGRLPAATAAEFAGMVDKLIAYEDAGPAPSPRAILVADGPDTAGNHTANSEATAALLLDAGLPDSAIQRLYLERLSAATVRTGLLAGLQGGADLLNYFGHAGVTALDHGLLSVADAKALTHPQQVPVMLGMTCLINRFEFPQLISLGEALLVNPAGGAAAVWSSGGYSYDASATALNDAVLTSLLQQRVPRLGDAILAALAAAAQGGELAPAVYNLLGDPATVNLLP